MTLAELEAAAEKVSSLEARLVALEERDHNDEPQFPEFVSLKTLCERCSLSYSTMRRGEHKHELPNKGDYDCVIASNKRS